MLLLRGGAKKTTTPLDLHLHPSLLFCRVTDVQKGGEVVARPGPHRQHLRHPPCDEMMSRGDRGGGVIKALLRPSFCVWILRSCRPLPYPILPFVIPVSRLSARAHLHRRVGATNEEWFFLVGSK